jgi:hypothetical protein
VNSGPLPQQTKWPDGLPSKSLSGSDKSIGPNCRELILSPVCWSFADRAVFRRREKLNCRLPNIHRSLVRLPIEGEMSLGDSCDGQGCIRRNYFGCNEQVPPARRALGIARHSCLHSEQIRLRDNRPDVRKPQHHIEGYQKPDNAKRDDGDKIGVSSHPNELSPSSSFDVD